MIKRVAILPDVHLTESLPKPYQTVRRFLKEYSPDEIILLGDFLNCSSLSHWDMDKRLLMEGRRYRSEIEFANKELDYLQSITKCITYIEGNHENWVEQYTEFKPEFRGLIELPTVLKLKERGIAWHPINTLVKRGKVYLTHGMYTNQYHSRTHLQAFGCNIVYGHSHNSQTIQMTMKMQEELMAYGLGCLCSHAPDYMRGRPCNWINQFALLDWCTNTGQFNLTPVNIIGNKFIHNGKMYR